MTSASSSHCVDVIIAAWNRSQTIERAVLSALAQSEVQKVIVIDDASCDETGGRVRRCDPGNKRVILKQLQTNVGPAAARNIAIELSTAPWLAILDGDDFFLPRRIERIFSYANDCDLVADRLLQVPEHHIDALHAARVVGGTFSAPQWITLEQFVHGNIRKRRAGLRQEFGFLKPLIRREFLDKHGLRYDPSLRLGEDYALYAQALAAGAKFLLVPTAGYVSVERPDSLSGRHSKADLERFRDSDHRLLARGALSGRERRAVAQHYVSADCRVQWLAVIEGFKSRSIKDFLLPFWRSPRISLYLLGKLASEFSNRSLALLTTPN